MDWKRTFKPNTLSSIVTIGATLISYIYTYMPKYTDASMIFTGFPNYSYIKNYVTYHGFPFLFYGPGQFLFVGFIVDLILWYLVVCMIIKGFSELKKK